MEIFTLAAIATASAVNAAMPGPCVVLTISRSARDGLGAGLLLSLGVLAANLILAAVALGVLIGVVAVSHQAFIGMKWLGAGVLLALAARMLLARDGDRGNQPDCVGGPLRNLAAGLAVGLSSPFNLVFLLALLPQLVPAAGLDLTRATLVTAAVIVGAAGSQIGATLIGTVSRGLGKSAAHRIEFGGSLSLIGFAVVVLATPIA